MAVFHESDAASAANPKKLTPLVIVIIVLAVLLCCCCALVAILLIATKGDPIGEIKDFLNKDSYLPFYLTLRALM